MAEDQRKIQHIDWDPGFSKLYIDTFERQTSENRVRITENLARPRVVLVRVANRTSLTSLDPVPTGESSRGLTRKHWRGRQMQSSMILTMTTRTTGTMTITTSKTATNPSRLQGPGATWTLGANSPRLVIPFLLGAPGQRANARSPSYRGVEST